MEHEEPKANENGSVAKIEPRNDFYKPAEGILLLEMPDWANMGAVKLPSGSDQGKPPVGRVLAMGRGRIDRELQTRTLCPGDGTYDLPDYDPSYLAKVEELCRVAPPCKVGEWVLFRTKSSGIMGVNDDLGRPRLLLPFEAVVAKVTRPEDINLKMIHE